MGTMTLFPLQQKKICLLCASSVAVPKERHVERRLEADHSSPVANCRLNS
jgi:hypothetical protein